MKTQLEAALKQAVEAILSEHQQRSDIPVRLTRPKSQDHGDYAANVAMPLAGLLGVKPQAVAKMILDRVNWPAAGRSILFIIVSSRLKRYTLI